MHQSCPLSVNSTYNDPCWRASVMTRTTTFERSLLILLRPTFLSLSDLHRASEFSCPGTHLPLCMVIMFECEPSASRAPHAKAAVPFDSFNHPDHRFFCYLAESSTWESSALQHLLPSSCPSTHPLASIPCSAYSSPPPWSVQAIRAFMSYRSFLLARS